MTLSGPILKPLSGLPPKSMVIFLHGVGSNGEDLISLGREWQKILPETIFLSPNAPERYDMAPNGYQWFSLEKREFSFIKKGAIMAAKKLGSYIDEQLKAYQLTADKLFIVGFSQGTMMALYAMPRREKSCKAIVGYSGMTVDDGSLQIEAKSKPLILLIHGERDDVIPIQALDGTKDCLEACGFSVKTDRRPHLGHSIDMHGLMHGAQFIRENL